MRAVRLVVAGVLIACVVGAVPPHALAAPSEVLEPQPEPVRPPWRFQLADVRVMLETQSLGRECPRHLVTMTGDGSGSSGCTGSTTAPVLFSVTEDEVLDFLTRAYNARFFDMPLRYGGDLRLVVHDGGMVGVQGVAHTDGTVRALTVKIGDYTKRVEAVEPCPEDLRELMDFARGFADRIAEQLYGRPSN